jgi:hypothetical protein
MAELTPLSIAYPLTRSQAKLKQGIESFEEKINKKNFKAQDKQPRLEFGSEYHGESADEETEVEESHKYPAAPLPFLVPKVPKSTYDHAGSSCSTTSIWYGALSHSKCS